MPMPQMITDRSEADVAHAKALLQKYIAGTTTAAERAEFISGLKGAYNAADLNRVGLAVQYLAQRLASVGVSVSVSPKTDWAQTDVPTQAQASRYIVDLFALASALTFDTVILPTNLDDLNHDAANRIEQLLVALNAALDRLVWQHCGAAVCGMEGIYL